jgi:hypothetical protein
VLYDAAPNPVADAEGEDVPPAEMTGVFVQLDLDRRVRIFQLRKTIGYETALAAWCRYIGMYICTEANVYNMISPPGVSFVP